ncbi:hypothetical protein KGY77_10450 [Candidatus Bipolaricaulota bacterium]|nr:hypothetical protein [Candidatus Bipolaricaulota bacterium]MBS3793046.1 hypothetical protein [Candidatus Bipolaricaulota bacterium]
MTCPECGEKFGAKPGTVFKYMNRLAESYVEEVEKRVEEYEKAAEEDEDDGKEGA